MARETSSSVQHSILLVDATTSIAQSPVSVRGCLLVTVCFHRCSAGEQARYPRVYTCPPRSTRPSKMPAQSSIGTLGRLAPRVSPIPHQRTLMPLRLMSPRKRKRSDLLPNTSHAQKNAQHAFWEINHHTRALPAGRRCVCLARAYLKV